MPERLEHRHLPSVTLPGITATSPADGATLPRAPQAFTITFDQSVINTIDSTFAGQLAPTPDQVFPTIIADDLDQDVEIDQVGPGGVLTPFAGNNGLPVNETVVTSTAADGATTTQLVVTMAPEDPPMQPGTYAFEINPNSLMAVAFGLVTDPTWYSAPGPIPIAQFTYQVKGPTLADATDLGTVGAQPQSFWSTLDPSQPQSAVALYRFTLPQGGTWQVDAKVLANSVGSLLTPALALIGPDGTVLATRDAGLGTASDPVDPELIRDLPGGTYYLGVSGARDLPGVAGGYDPVTGTPGTLGTDDPAGVYDLQVSATPAVPPAKLVNFDLEQADPLSPSPTGMDLTFSAPIDVTPLARPDQLVTAVSVVDASGQTWPISAVGYDASQDRLTFLFDEALPAGDYSLVAPAQGGLTDLAGQPVVGLSGDSSTVLATWTVAAPTGPAAPNDLGVVWPGSLNATWNSGVSGSLALGAGQGVSDRFVVISPGLYELQTQVDTGSIDAGITASDGTSVLAVDGQAGLNQSYFQLEPGVYHLQVAADGSAGASVAWTLRPVSFDYEKIANNGVGQSSALTLALVGPVASDPATSASTAASGISSVGATTTVTVTGPSVSASSGPAPGVTGFSAMALSPALLATPETSLAGLPAANGWNTAAVGPMAGGTMADAGRGLPAGIGRSSSPLGTDPTVGEEDLEAGPVATAMGTPSVDGTAAALSAGGAEAASARADAMALALAESDPMVRIAGWIAGRMPVPSATPRQPEIPATDFTSTLLASATTPTDPESGGTDRDRGRASLSQADLGLPVALLLGTALTYRLSQPVRKWWRRHPMAHPTWPRPYGFTRAGRRMPQETC